MKIGDRIVAAERLIGPTKVIPDGTPGSITDIRRPEGEDIYVIRFDGFGLFTVSGRDIRRALPTP